MTSSLTDPRADTADDLAVSTERLARAYCGPAHGQCWEVGDPSSPASTIQLDAGTQRVSYRLVVHPLSHRPVRDHLGHLLYMPVLFRR